MRRHRLIGQAPLPAGTSCPNPLRLETIEPAEGASPPAAFTNPIWIEVAAD